MNTTSAAELPAATKLAVDRTRLAHERTLMAWVRTATSLISFGFTIYKFLQYVRQDQGLDAGGETFFGPRGFALIMIGTGLTALILATVDHRRSMQALRLEYGDIIGFSLATLVAALIGILGIVGLLMVGLRQ